MLSPSHLMGFLCQRMLCRPCSGKPARLSQSEKGEKRGMGHGGEDQWGFGGKGTTSSALAAGLELVAAGVRSTASASPAGGPKSSIEAASPPPEPTVGSLPAEILEKVVSFLPLRDAVRTSAVSRAWRRLWESAPGLGLDWEYDTDPAVVDAVLMRYSRPVYSFRFHLSAASFSHADGWVPLLAGKSVQALHLHFEQFRDIEPHDMDVSIFSCRELTCLNLKGCDIPAPPPGLAGFPHLTRLYLWAVGFPETGVRGLEALIAESPLIEVLWLTNLWFPEDEEDEDYEHEEWGIQVQNLQSLTIRSEDGKDYGWLIRELPSIEDVKISFSSYSINRDFVELLTALAPEVEVGVDILSAHWTDGLLGNLKSVSMYLATCQPNEMHFIEFVLSKARQLQEFRICVNEYCLKSNEELIVEILKYRRASPQAKVFFSRMEFI
ncbi:hypothetical protein ACP70R_016284 [Stipagrostis hirtigluma subsp. patula]